MEADQWVQQYASPQMAQEAYRPGPYGYPIHKFRPSVVLGKFFVLVEGDGRDAAQNEVDVEMFYEKIIGCGIDGGLVAPGVDPEKLTR